MIEIGVGVGLIILASALAKRILGAKHQTFHLRSNGSIKTASVPSADRQKALEAYERLAKDKLDVIKTALAMGYDQEDISRLDARLERLIGRDQLERIARGELPAAIEEIGRTDLQDEMRVLKQMRAR